MINARSVVPAACLSLCACVFSTSSQSIKSGRYLSSPHEILEHTEGTAQVEDEVEVQPIDNDHFHFRFTAVSNYLNFCNLSGTASRTGRNAYSYNGRDCTLHFKAGEGRLEVKANGGVYSPDFCKPIETTDEYCSLTGVIASGTYRYTDED